MKSIYPDLNVEAGIYSPNTGIIDVPELINALEGDIQHNNGLISLNTKFISAQKNNSGFSISCDDGNKFLINSKYLICLLYTSPSPRDRTRYRMPSSA